MITWEPLKNSMTLLKFWRAKVPGGWLVLCGGSLAFYPDADHTWDGNSLV